MNAKDIHSFLYTNIILTDSSLRLKSLQKGALKVQTAHHRFNMQVLALS